jgi:guanylate kinase
MLFAVAAPSGTGKTSIVKEILNQNPDLLFSVSATTRKKRANEIDGKDYFFISEEEFKQKISEGDFIEYEVVFSNDYYGTLKSVVDGYIKTKMNVIFDLDVKGAISLKNYYEDFIVLIFIKPPDKDSVINRLKSRGTETEEQINGRLARFDLEMSKINEFDYIVLNDNLNDAVKQVNDLILKFKNKESKNIKEQ